MGFAYIAAGIVFLFNPNLHVFDILPDFIGVLLIYRGLFTMSFSSDRLRDTRTALWKLSIVTAARAASVLFLPGASDSFTLLLVFTFGVLEAMYAIPAILYAFEGLYDLGRRYDAQSVYAFRKNRRGVLKERAEKLKTFTIVFFFVKTVGAILPELTALDLRNSLSADAYTGVSIAMFKPYFYFVTFVITLVFGIIWLVRMLKYVKEMKRDGNLTAGISAYYRDFIEADPGVCAAIQMKNVLLLFLIAVLATFPLQFDRICILPSCIAALILVLALRILARFDKLSLWGIIPAVIVAVLSLVNLILQIPYFAEYDAEAARYLSNAIRLYKPIRILGTVEFVFVLLLFGYFVFILCRVFKQHAALVGGMTHAPQYSASARSEEIMHSVYARIAGVSVVGGIYFILRAASFTTTMYYPELWMLHVAVSILFVVMVIHAVSGVANTIYERLENKY